jgi:hypothetical protein
VVVVTDRVVVVDIAAEVVAGGTVVAVVVDDVVFALVVVPAASAGGGTARPDKPATPAANAKPIASFDRHGPIALLVLFHLLFATTRAQRGTRRSVKQCPPQMTPSLSALRTQGITSSSISSSVVVASKPKTSFALSTEGTRLATSCSKGVSLT